MSLTCEQFVELVTEFLEGSLGSEDRRRFVEHLAACDGCEAYLDQFKATIAETGALRPEQLAPEVRAKFLAAFRNWSA